MAKAKETRMVVEPMITRARHASELPLKDAAGVHARRQVGKMIKDRTIIGELFSTIAAKVGTRPGGYTRIVKLGQRQGDGAEMAVIELVDFNTGQEEEKPTPAAKAKEKKSPAPRKPKKAKEEKASPVAESNSKDSASKKEASPSETKESR